MEIIATLGPRSREAASIAPLVAAGADTARINASHLDEEALAALLREAAAGGFPPAAVVVDLQGGKTRFGALAAPLEVDAGTPLELVAPGAPGGGAGVPALPVDRRAFLEALAVGDRLRIDDGRVEALVRQVGGSRALVEVQGPGVIAARKGVARAGAAPLALARLSARDRALLAVARQHGVRRFAVSYALDPALLADAAADAGPYVHLAAKLEHPAAVSGWAALAEASHELWLCRGDLGAEAGLQALSGLQRRFLAEAVPAARGLLAGQLLHHMTVSPRPTRAEVCQLGDLAHAGVAGFVLSDETATGPHGPEAVRWLAALTRGQDAE